MRIRSMLPLIALVVASVGGCVVKEYDGPPPATGTTTAANPAPATPTPATTAPPSSAITPATPATVATPTGVVAPATTTTGTTPTPATGGVVKSGVTPIAAAGAMSKANVFGQPAPFTGAIAGTVYAIPEGTTALPTNWTALPKITTIYSQAWNVAPHDFKEGFPGVPGDRVEWFAIRWEGTILVTKGELYHFKMNSDDGAKLWIDGTLVVNDDGLHSSKIAEGNATLKSGNHKLLLEYFQGPKFQLALQIWVSGTAVPEHILTSSF